MNWFHAHWLHLVLIAGYLVMLAHHAWVGRQHVRSLDDYLVAGRRLGGFVIAMSFYATFMSTNTFIGAAGKSWDYGLVWCTGGIVLTSLACLSWWVVAPKFVPLTRQYNSLTVADFLGTHYQSLAVRRAAAAIVAFSSVLYLVAIYRGAALALSSFLDLPYAGCVLAVLVIVTAYTLMGGFESVVLTDAVQGVLMLVGAVVILGAMIYAGGGWGTILTTLHQRDPKLTSFTGTGFSAAMAYSLAVGVKYLVEPRQLSRFYGLRDTRALRVASVLAPLAILVTYACLLPLGALARTLLSPDAVESTDNIVPLLLGPANMLGPLAGTAFLLVLASAAMSSIDSVLLVAASTIDRDLFGSLAPTHSSQDAPQPSSDSPPASGRPVQRTRIWVIVVSLIAAGTALLPMTKDIVQVTKFSGSLYGACFLPVLVVGLFVGRRSAPAALATMFLGSVTVVTVFTLRSAGLTDLQEVYPGILVGLLTFVVGSQLTK